MLSTPPLDEDSTDESSSATTPRQWWLAGHLPSGTRSANIELEVIRELSEDELAKTQDANDLLNRLASATPYSNLVNLFQAFKQVLDSDRSPERKIVDANRIIQALGAAVAQFLRGVREDITGHLAGSAEANVLTEGLNVEIGRPAFRALIAASESEARPLVVVDGAVAVAADVAGALRNIVGNLSSVNDLVETVYDAILIAQRIVGLRLQAYGTQIRDAHMWLRRLASEVPDGIPILIHGDFLGRSSSVENLQMPMQRLALPAGVHLHRALLHAKRFLPETQALFESRSDGPAEALSEASSEEKTRAETSPPDMISESNEDASDSSAHASTAAHRATEQAGQETGDLQSGSQPIDWRALLHHTIELTDELEQAWSSAIQPEALEAAMPGIEARFRSLFASIRRGADHLDRALRSAGVHVQRHNYPLTAEQLEEVALTPTAEQLCRQLELAQLVTLQSLLEALQGIRHPSGQRITLPDNSIETWWESGAFLLIRLRAEHLVRIVEELRSAHATLTQAGDLGSNVPYFLDHLKLAYQALQRGDAEASLLHSNIALRSRCQLETNDLPNRLLEHLAVQPQLAAHKSLLLKFQAAVGQLANGFRLDAGAVLLVAQAVHSLVAELCFVRPGLLHDIYGGGDDE
ncbi:hypothetical protein AB0C14_38565 [Microbispora hainanensis]|uniref:hypothetical protein n=1 Tax=Microbispora hainanensis TaxID=568844 RepID=UPI0033CCDA37